MPDRRKPEQIHFWILAGDNVYWNGVSVALTNKDGGLHPECFTRNIDEAIRFMRAFDARIVRDRLFPSHAFAIRVELHSESSDDGKGSCNTMSAEEPAK